MIKKHISAQAGQPSTFWSPDNGKTWYRSKKEAEKGDASVAVNPQDFVYNKSFWAQNKKTILWCLGFLVVLGVCFYLYRKGVITINIRK